jgi:hypothetical protein
VTTAADVIAALNQRRKLKSLRPEAPGRLPPGWQGWLDAMPVLDGHAGGAPASSWVDAFVQRPLRTIPRAPAAMGRLQSLGHLLQQNWTPDARDERGLRIGVGAFDVVLHIVLVGLLLWLMYLRFIALAQLPPEQDEAVQVEFIGRGNIAEGGGAIAGAGAESAPAAAAPATRAPTPAPATGRPDAPLDTMAVPPQPQVAASSGAPQRVREIAPPVAAEAAQPLAVTEVREPEPQAFRLPPPKLREVRQPQLQVREVQPRDQVEEIPTLRTQPQRSLQPREVQADVKVPELRDRPQELDVPAPQRMATVQARSAPSQASSNAQVQVPQLRGELRDIPMPPGGAPTPSAQAGSGTSPQASTNNPGAGGERGTAPAAGQAQAGTGAGAKPAEQGGRGVAAAGSGAGPAAKPAPGGWPGPAKSDDWGASKRNVAGTGTGSGDGRDGKGDGKPGLFDDDGRPRLSDEWTQVSGIDVDRSGTWLKRPGLEYRATRFDQYWIPQGTLLEEWVRRGIKKVAIPIPGSKRRLECVVSLLQLGGGCFPVNPDVNEQPARARPAPDIPFKPGLQEDNGSVQPAQ